MSLLKSEKYLSKKEKEEFFAKLDTNMEGFNEDTGTKANLLESVDPWRLNAESVSELVSEIFNHDLNSNQLDQIQKKDIHGLIKRMDEERKLLENYFRKTVNFTNEEKDLVKDSISTLEDNIATLKALEKDRNPNVAIRTSSYLGKLLELTKEGLKNRINNMREFIEDRRDKGIIAYSSFGHKINKNIKNLYVGHLNITLDSITKDNTKIKNKLDRKIKTHEFFTNVKNVFKGEIDPNNLEREKFILEKCQSDIKKAEDNRNYMNAQADKLKIAIGKELDYSLKFDTDISLSFMNHYNKFGKSEVAKRDAEVKQALKEFKHNKELDVAGARDTIIRMSEATYELSDGQKISMLDSDQLHVIREAIKEGFDVSEIMNVIQRSNRTANDIPSAENLKIYFACQEYGYTLDKYPTFADLAAAKPRTFDSIEAARENPVLQELNRVHELNMSKPLVEMQVPEQYQDTVNLIIEAEKSCDKIVEYQTMAENHIKNQEELFEKMSELNQEVTSEQSGPNITISEEELNNLLAMAERAKALESENMQLKNTVASLEKANEEKADLDEPDLDEDDMEL